MFQGFYACFRTYQALFTCNEWEKSIFSTSNENIHNPSREVLDMVPYLVPLEGFDHGSSASWGILAILLMQKQLF